MKCLDVVLILLILVAVGFLMAGRLKSPNDNNSQETKQPVNSKVSKGIVTGIVSSEEGFGAMVGTVFVREGDTIDEITIIKIHRDKIEFEKDDKRWIQGLNETPGPQW